MPAQQSISQPPVFRKVLVLSKFLGHPRGSRPCPACGAVWTVAFPNGPGNPPNVTRNGAAANNTILDHLGNNAAVECC
jgi:hypothetical protein